MGHDKIWTATKAIGLSTKFLLVNVHCTITIIISIEGTSTHSSLNNKINSREHCMLLRVDPCTSPSHAISAISNARKRVDS